MDVGSGNATLILNGRWPEPGRQPLLPILRLLLRPASWRKGLAFVYRIGWRSLWEQFFPKPRPFLALDAAPLEVGVGQAAESRVGTKRVLCLDLPRDHVVSAFLESDLFVFASRIEYSPLVLFEAAAAGTPFLTVPVGNSPEIVQWTGGGWLCPANKDDRGYTKVSPAVLAREMEKAIRSPEYLRQLSEAGRHAWQNRFTWAKIARSYERILQGETVVSPMIAKVAEATVEE
jgi:glycosyltransferase involved in cell wall biosynthesis